MKYRIQKTPDTHDSDDICFMDDEGNKIGFGYMGKEDKNVGLMRCPECKRENYALAAMSGCCAFCGFDAGEYIINSGKEV